MPHWDEDIMTPRATIHPDRHLTYNTDFWYAIGMHQDSPYSGDCDACLVCPLNGPNNMNYECCGELERYIKSGQPLTVGQIAALKYFAKRYSNESYQIVIEDLR